MFYSRQGIATSLVPSQPLDSLLQQWLPWMESACFFVKGVLANLGDYAMHATNIPLECVMLCEISSLASCSTHLGYPFDLFTARLENLDRIIELICCRLPHGQIPFAYFVHRVIMWLRGNVKRKDRRRLIRVPTVQGVAGEMSVRFVHAACKIYCYLMRYSQPPIRGNVSPW